MTLTAIASNKRLFNPSVLIEMGNSRSIVSQQMRELQESGLFCPHCHKKNGKLIPVRFRGSESKKVHFFHIREGGVERECAHHSPESEKHLSAKAAIAEALRRRGLVDITLELRMQVNPGLPWCQPDLVVVYPVGTKEAHEVQVSQIDCTELERRTARLKDNGVDRVVWYLYGKNFSDANREWCHKNGVECWHLSFENGDDSKPRWKQDLFVAPKQSAPRSKSPDKCDRRSLAERSPWKPRAEKPQKLPEKPVFKPDPIEFCYVPFRVDSWVRLKCAPSRIYTVLAVKTCVSFIKSEGAHSHDYQLLNREGKPAFWCHSQLEEMR